MSKPCRYVPAWGHYLASHELNCRDNTCRGCQPCSHDEKGNRVRHCTARPSCGQHLADSEAQTCARCVGVVRRDIGRILTVSVLLTAAAIEAGGVDTEAASLAGPAADPFAWTSRRVEQLKAGIPADKIDPEDAHHPDAVLGRWEVLVREHLGQVAKPSHRPTASSSGKYLTGHLTRLAQDPDFAWAELAAEIHACESHLEDVLNTAKRAETGAPCPSCAPTIDQDGKERKPPPLVKVYAHWCTRDDCTRLHDNTGAYDVWRCPACKATWNEAEYRLWVADDYLDNAEHLTAADMQMVYGIKPSTLRTWADRGKVRKRGHNNRGQQLYDVADARTEHARATEGARA